MRSRRGATTIAKHKDLAVPCASFDKHVDSLLHLGGIDGINGTGEVVLILLSEVHQIILSLRGLTLHVVERTDWRYQRIAETLKAVNPKSMLPPSRDNPRRY